jgi:FtsP/CotA-like multicopper oxidase with cupredoxin domain
VIVDPAPVSYNYNRRDIVVLNIANHSLMLGPAERADVIVDFSGVPDGSKLILYNDAPAPVPAFDTRYDYYTGDPDQRSTGGAPTTMAGYGPNTRTVMQFQVSGPAASTFSTSALAAALPVAYKASQPAPIVPEKAYGAATNTYSRIASTSLTFSPSAGTTVTLAMQPKAIQELFELNYGRMNATLGVELPFTNFNTQTTIPLGYLDPRTEIMKNSNVTTATQIGTSLDGAQIWKITHNGVDTHAIHFHLFNVQLINRVGWDGAIRPPDANELGWKETVRMNPLEDAIVAFRPVAPSLPFKIGDSIRPLDPTQPLGASLSVTDPTTGNATTVLNVMTNFGWEYVWHCHLLGHEENDMMRPVEFDVSPAAPSALKAVAAPIGVNQPKVVLTWTNNAVAPLAVGNYLVQRSTNPSFTANVVTFSVSGAVTTYSDTSVGLLVTYYYRIRAENSNSFSVWSGTASTKSAGQLPMALTNLHVNSEGTTSLNIGWSNPTGGAARTSIQVQYATAAGGPWTTRTTTANATSYNITGLVHLRKYWIRVVAVNGFGSTLSSTITATTN